MINTSSTEEIDALTHFFCSQEWPYHSVNRMSSEQIKNRIESNYFHNSNAISFWIVQSNAPQHHIGFIRLFDLEDIGDGSPLFDLRISESFRGKGIGKLALSKLVEYVFTTWPHQLRIEGTTRVDNLAMRKAFESNLFVKEGHYRKTWPNANGDLMDTVHYALLKSDWEKHEVTPVPWD